MLQRYILWHMHHTQQSLWSTFQKCCNNLCWKLMRIVQTCYIQTLPTCRPTEMYQEHRCAASLWENLRGKKPRKKLPSFRVCSITTWKNTTRGFVWKFGTPKFTGWSPFFHLKWLRASQTSSCLGSFPFRGFLSWTKLQNCCHCRICSWPFQRGLDTWVGSWSYLLLQQY